jgi:type III secretion protein C
VSSINLRSESNLFNFSQWSNVGVLVASLACSSALAQPRTPPWQGDTVNFTLNGKRISDALREFAAKYRVPIALPNNLDGTLSGQFRMSASTYLNTLCEPNGLIAYFDGSVLNIVQSGDTKSQMVRLSVTTPAKVREAINRMGIADARYPIYYDDANRTIFVSGPRRMVDLVVDTAITTDESAYQFLKTDIAVFPLKHARAIDQRVGDTGVPGMVSTLRGLFGGLRGPEKPERDLASNSGLSTAESAQSSNDSSGSSRSGSEVSTTEVPMRALDRAASRLAAVRATSGSPYTGTVGGASGANADTLPSFQADTRTNSVIVRDIPERMGQYADVIRRLDVPISVFEVEATIIDISQEDAESLGIDWRASGRDLDMNSSGSDRSALPFGQPLSANGGAINAGLMLTSLTGSAQRYLIARVNALSREGNARIQNRPKIVTLENNEAVIENKQEFYIKVAGNQDARLFTASTGTRLKIIPNLVSKEDGSQIRITLNIEDGGFTGQSVEQVPITQKTMIGTQTLLNLGQSLVVGGFSQDLDNKTVSGIPGLRKLPLIGSLFRTTSQNKRTVERLFIITPRLIQFNQIEQ